VLPPTAQGLVDSNEGDSRARFTVCQEILGAQARALSIEHREKVGDAKLIAQSRQASSFLAGLGRSAEQITVSEEAPLVAATTSSTSGLISESQIKDLPLNGRSFDQLLTMNPGVSNSSTNTQNNAWTAFSVAGKRPETNRFVINGIDYVGGQATGLFITPSGAGGQSEGKQYRFEVVHHFQIRIRILYFHMPAFFSGGGGAAVSAFFGSFPPG